MAPGMRSRKLWCSSDAWLAQTGGKLPERLVRGVQRCFRTTYAEFESSDCLRLSCLCHRRKCGRQSGDGAIHGRRISADPRPDVQMSQGAPARSSPGRAQYAGQRPRARERMIWAASGLRTRTRLRVQTRHRSEIVRANYIVPVGYATRSQGMLANPVVTHLETQSMM